jgi:hypothetical protein
MVAVMAKANEIIPADAPSELHQLQFDYAWKWFCFHADQRVKMFNYMLIVFGIFAAGVVNALHNQMQIDAVVGLCFFAAVLAVIFMLLDRRNRDLVWLGEDVLMDLERKAIFGEDKKIKGRYDREIDFGILWRQALEERGWRKTFEERCSPKCRPIGSLLHDVGLGKHRILLPGIGGLIGVLFFAAVGFLIWGGLGGVFFGAVGLLILIFLLKLLQTPPPH